MALAAVATPEQAQILAPEEALGTAKSMAVELSQVRDEIAVYGNYYIGAQTMPKEPQRLTKKYVELLNMCTSNWCRLVIDVVAERLFVGAIKSSQDDDLDTDAWSY